MSDWNELKTFILSKENEDIHKIVWEGFAMITETNGNRHKVDDSWTDGQVKALFDRIRQQQGR